MILNRIIIARPGGNDTALVFDPIPVSQYKTVNALIQKAKPEIEQVMFVDLSGSIPRGIMAGGEFCGNATRALGYYLLNGRDGEIALSISGSDTELQVRVEKNNARAKMPIVKDFSGIESISPTKTIVHLQGISHLVIDADDADAQKICECITSVYQKELALNLLRQFGLDKCPAAGVILIENIGSNLSIKPFVYVSAIDTFYYETACGSGSIAVGLVKAYRQRKDMVGLKLLQPSGMPIDVDVELNGRGFAHASINGPIEILYEGPLQLAE